jgi:hypothetical protein
MRRHFDNLRSRVEAARRIGASSTGTASSKSA